MGRGSNEQAALADTLEYGNSTDVRLGLVDLGRRPAMLEDIRNIIGKELDPGERLIWYGKPADGIRFRSSEIFLVPFSVMWGGFAIFWEYSVLSSGHAPIFFVLWGIPFVCMGLYLIVGRFIYDAYSRTHTFYGVTNERVIIISDGLSRKVKTLDLKNLSEISYVDQSSGWGTISFGAALSPFGFFGSTNWPGTSRHSPPQFEMIENAKKVFEIICATQRGRQSTADTQLNL